MELLFKEILNGNTAVMAVLFIFLFRAHKEAMAKLDKLTEAMARVVTTNELHAQELDYGTKEIKKLHGHNDKQDEKLHKLSNEIHGIKNQMMTKDHVELLLEAKVK